MSGYCSPPDSPPREAAHVSQTLLDSLAAQADPAALRGLLDEWRTPATSLTAQLDARLNTEKQDTLLTWAARHGQAEAVRLLLEAGADVGAADGDDASALLLACEEDCLECVELLLYFGAAVNQTADGGVTPLFMACQYGHLEIAWLLLQARAAVSQAKNNGATPLLIACQWGHLEIAMLLHAAGAAVDQAAADGTTPLYMACQKAHLEIVRLLLEADAAVGQARNDGSTPLLIACQEGHLDVAKLLSSYGASRAAVPPYGTPEEVANRRGHADLAAWLVASRGWTPLAHLESLTAAHATSLLRSGASLHEGEPTPLQRAAGSEGEAAALIRRAAAPWSLASHFLFPAAARARAALLVPSLLEIHEWQLHRHPHGITACNFVTRVLHFALSRATQ